MWNCNNWMGGFPHNISSYIMGFGPFGGILSILFFVLMIYLIVKIVRSFFPPQRASLDKKDSLRILKNRFAKGEISQEEYSRMYEILKT
jgi:putative membrane protein